MQYINTAYGKEAREKETGQAEQEEKMAFRLNKRRVVEMAFRLNKRRVAVAESICSGEGKT